MREGLLEFNPIIATNKPPQAPARDRVLTDEELKAIWNVLGEDYFGAVVKLLALTGLRREEVGLPASKMFPIGWKPIHATPTS
jgi:integrase